MGDGPKCLDIKGARIRHLLPYGSKTNRPRHVELLRYIGSGDAIA